MKAIPLYNFHKTKYGEELLIDIVSLSEIKKYRDKHPTHVLTYFDITFITEGEGEFAIDEKEYDIVSGDVIFSMPGEIRKWNKNNILDGYALIFEEEFLLSFFNDHQFVYNLSYFGSQRKSSKINISGIQNRINNLLQNIITEIKEYKSKDKHILRALLYEILMVLNREYINSNKTESNQLLNRHVKSFISLVSENFKTNHSTNFYADKLCITPNYLNEIVRKTFNITAKRYIINQIIIEAKKMLTYTDLSISDISDNLNYTSPAYFIRFFRHETNYTPLEYRNSIKR